MTEAERNESRKNYFYNALEEAMRQHRTPTYDDMLNELWTLLIKEKIDTDAKNMIEAWIEFKEDHHFWRLNDE